MKSTREAICIQGQSDQSAFWLGASQAVGQHFYVLPDFVYKARPINHFSCSQQQRQVDDTVDDIMPLPVEDRLRVGEGPGGDASKENMPIIESLTNLLLEHATT
jgi:hypothetical protein